MTVKMVIEQIIQNQKNLMKNKKLLNQKLNVIFVIIRIQNIILIEFISALHAIKIYV